MISGFLTPGEPLFIDFIILNYFKIRKTMGPCSKQFVANLIFLEIGHFEMPDQILKHAHRKMTQIHLNNLGNLGYEINIYKNMKWKCGKSSELLNFESS